MLVQQRSRATRESILDAAAIEFDRFGFERGRLGRVVAATGMTKGAFYFHFRSKEDLALSLIRSKDDYCLSIVESVQQEHGHGLEGLIELTHVVALAARDNVRMRAAMRLGLELHARGQALKQWEVIFDDMLQQGVVDGHISREIPTRQAAAALVGCSFGVQAVTAERDDSDCVTRNLQQMWNLILPGLGTRSKDRTAVTMLHASKRTELLAPILHPSILDGDHRFIVDEKSNAARGGVDL